MNDRPTMSVMFRGDGTRRSRTVKHDLETVTDVRARAGDTSELPVRWSPRSPSELALSFDRAPAEGELVSVGLYGKKRGSRSKEECIFDPPRPLDAWEIRMASVFISQLDPDWRAPLRAQLGPARIPSICGCGCLTSHVIVPPDPAYRVPGAPSGMVRELVGTDRDGMAVLALLFLREGYLSSLEVLRADSTAFDRPPDPRWFLAEDENLRQTDRYWTRKGVPPEQVSAKVEREREMLREGRRAIPRDAAEVEGDRLLSVEPTRRTADGERGDGSASE
jgi:hypothetical protein